MSTPADQLPRVTPIHPDAVEHRRQLAQGINRAAAGVEYLSSRTTTNLVGFYDQVNDDIDLNTPGNQNLDAATNYQPGEYYVLITTGTFSTAIPELTGKAGGPGDQVISDGTVWVLVAISTDYLSATVDDTAAGIITHSQLPVCALNPSTANQLTRKAYVDGAVQVVQGNLDTHIGYLYSAPEDPHGIQAHTDLTDIHFSDVPSDGVPYVRTDKQWQKLAVDTAVMRGSADSFTLNTTPSIIMGYELGGGIGSFSGMANQTNGVITIPEAGLYRITFAVVGTQGNSTKEESAWCFVRYANAGGQNGDYVWSVFDIATDKTDERSFSATFSESLPLDAEVSVGLVATAGLGTFTVVRTTFEISMTPTGLGSAITKFAHALTLGFDGVDRYGYATGMYGGLVPDIHGAATITQLFVDQSTQAVALFATGDLYATNNITVEFENEPHVFTLTRLGGGFYQSVGQTTEAAALYASFQARGAGSGVGVLVKQA